MTDDTCRCSICTTEREIERIVAEATIAEREACAKVADVYIQPELCWAYNTAGRVAAAIRARSATHDVEVTDYLDSIAGAKP